MAHGDRADRRLDRLARDATGAQQGGRRRRKIEHRGLDTDKAGAAVEDEGYAIAQGLRDMFGPGRADGAAAVGGRPRDRPARRPDQRLGDRMRRRADRHGIEAGGRQQRDGRTRAARQHQRKRARPEARRQPVGGVVPAHEMLRGLGVEHVADQRIELRPSLGREDRRDRALVGGVAAQAVDRFRREGDQLAVAQQPCRLGHGFCGRCRNLHRAALLRAMKCGLEKRGLP